MEEWPDLVDLSEWVSWLSTVTHPSADPARRKVTWLSKKYRSK